jgi:choline-sulfatase
MHECTNASMHGRQRAVRVHWCIGAFLHFAAVAACSAPPVAKPAAHNLVLITIDTLRADHVGAYGYARAHTPTLDAVARAGVLFERAYAAAPITLPSHATLLSGRYPPGHGARDNGMHVSAGVPTLATELQTRGFKTAAFVAAFPLDHQFGLDRGFDVYGDRLGRTPDGKLANERPASQVVDEALSWLRTLAPSTRAPSTQAPGTEHPALSTQHPAPFFLWIHLFEPHAPYGDPASGRSTIDRYDDEIATADREAGRLLAALQPVADRTLVVVAGDHGEAFGEHGEYAHSIFVYDTTLRVPLVVRGPGVTAGSKIAAAVTLADIAPTATRMLGFEMKNVDGIDLSPFLNPNPNPNPNPQSAIRNPQSRELYAESFAPLLEFGWSPLRAIRSGTWKFVAAPKPELYDLDHDPAETQNVVEAQTTTARGLENRADRYSPARLPDTKALDTSGFDRLRALGYSSPSQSATRNPQSAMAMVDPKDRREIAARIAQVTSGELSGQALASALEQILAVDPSNSQAHLRLGYVRLAGDDCAHAESEFRAAMNGGLPGADAPLGLATCLGRRNDLAGAERALAEAQRREPGNPVVTANVGILQAAQGRLPAAIATLKAALAADPGLDEARFNLAIAYAKSGRGSEAAATARDLLSRLPPSAPQRAEVERLLRAVQ